MAYWQTLKAQLNEARGEKKAKKIWVSNFLSFNYSPWEEGETGGRKKGGRKEENKASHSENNLENLSCGLAKPKKSIFSEFKGFLTV